MFNVEKKKKNSWSISRLRCVPFSFFFFFLPSPSLSLPYNSSPPSCHLAPNRLYQNHMPAKVVVQGCRNSGCVTSAQFDRLWFGAAAAAGGKVCPNLRTHSCCHERNVANLHQKLNFLSPLSFHFPTTLHHAFVISA